MLISVVVINLTRQKYQKVLPWMIKKHLDGKFGDFLLLDHINETEVTKNYFHYYHFFFLFFSFVLPKQVPFAMTSI